jgi:hypothetical protein
MRLLLDELLQLEPQLELLGTELELGLLEEIVVTELEVLTLDEEVVATELEVLTLDEVLTTELDDETGQPATTP